MELNDEFLFTISFIAASTSTVTFLTKSNHFNPLKTKRRLLYLKTQFVPRSKHFSYRI